MLGAILGDIIGSRFEFNKLNNKSENFDLFTKDNCFTDDTIMTIATTDALINNKDLTKTYREWGKKYPNSGYGEMFRLFITGGIDSTFLHSCMIIPALRIKQAVVEKDEFEHDIRRAMNYGHSIGHAFEAITEYKIPHGIAVTLGILIENEISCILGYLNKHTADELLKIGKTLVPKEILPILNTINLSHILEYLKQDKKTEGNVLKIPFLVAMGNIQIKDFELNDTNKDKIMIATNYVSTLLGEKE